MASSSPCSSDLSLSVCGPRKLKNLTPWEVTPSGVVDSNFVHLQINLRGWGVCLTENMVAWVFISQRVAGLVKRFRQRE